MQLAKSMSSQSPDANVSGRIRNWTVSMLGDYIQNQCTRPGTAIMVQ